MNNFLLKILLYTPISFASQLAGAQEFDLSGYLLHTEQHIEEDNYAKLVANATLPNDDAFILYYWFEGDPETAELTALFDGEPLAILTGSALESNQLATLGLDISNHKALPGVLELKLTSEPGAANEILIIDRLDSTQEISEEDSEPEPEPESEPEPEPAMDNTAGSESSGGGYINTTLLALFALLLIRRERRVTLVFS